MLFTTIFLAISSSIDAIGIGITYGIKNATISNKGKLVIFFVSFIVTIISLYLGNFLKALLPHFIVDYLGSFIFILMGLFICFQALDNNETISNKNIDNKEEKNKIKTYSFFIKFLGITIKIIKNPISSDLDNSKKIDGKEAIFLGLALSMDTICTGICGAAIGINNYIFPFLISCFQLIFLEAGNHLGKKLYNFYKLPTNIWSITSGILLIIIGIIKVIT